jgi:TP901 family phage tail tape measure protein
MSFGSLGSIWAEIGLDTSKLNMGVVEAQRTLSGFSASMDSNISKLKNVGDNMSRYLTLPVLAAGAVSAKFAADFQQQMTLVQTQAGATADEVKKMSQAILDMGGTTEFGPKELAKGLYWIESAGYRGAVALDTLKVAADLASVGQSDMSTTTNALVSVMKAMPDSIHNASEAASMMNAIVGNGKMTMDDLNAAIGTGFLSAANTFGVSLQSVGSALAFMTSAGIPASDAATKLKMGITLLGAPSKKAQEVLGALGVSMEDAQAATDDMTVALSQAGVTQSQLAEDLRKPNGLYIAIKDLKQHLIDSGVSATAAGDIIAKAFGGGRTGTAIMAMVNDTDGLAKSYDNVGKSAGNFGDAVKTQSATAADEWATDVASMETNAVRLGTVVLPAVSEALGKVTLAMNGMTTQQQQYTLGTIVLLAALGPILSVLANLTSLLGSASAAMGAGTAGGVALYGAAMLMALGLASASWHSDNIIGKLYSMATGLWTVVAALDSVVYWWNRYLDATSISGPGAPSGGGGESGGYATGGWVTRPTLGWVGEAGPEFVLSQPMLQDLQKGITPAGLAGKLGGSNITVNVYPQQAGEDAKFIGRRLAYEMRTSGL